MIETRREDSPKEANIIGMTAGWRMRNGELGEMKEAPAQRHIRFSKIELVAPTLLIASTKY
jgi:hypothetical protein